MRAIVAEQYGPPSTLQYREGVEKPTPAEGEVLIRVHAASVNMADIHMTGGELPVRLMTGSFGKPAFTSPGADFAGVIEAVGPGVTGIQPGDRVYGEKSDTGFGSFADYTTARADLVAPMPQNLSFTDAAAVALAGMTAMQGLRLGGLAAGQKVLVTGASGGVGSFAVQIAKAHGAHVTATCRTEKMDMVRALGADEVIDFTHTDFADGGAQYDLILDNALYRSIRKAKPALNPGGTYVVVGGSIWRIIQTMLFKAFISDVEVLSLRLEIEPLRELTALIEAGKVKPPVDRCFSLKDVPEAMRYFQSGDLRGKVVIEIAPE